MSESTVIDTSDMPRLASKADWVAKARQKLGPQATPMVVVKWLSEQGVKVSAGYVKALRAAEKGTDPARPASAPGVATPGRKRRRRRSAHKNAASPKAQARGPQSTASGLDTARGVATVVSMGLAFMRAVGSKSEAKRVLDALEPETPETPQAAGIPGLSG